MTFVNKSLVGLVASSWPRKVIQMKTIVVSARITTDEYDRLAAIAEIAGVSLNRTLRDAIAAHINEGGTTRSATQTAEILSKLVHIDNDLKKQGNLFAYSVKAGPVDEALSESLKNALEQLRNAVERITHK